MRDLQQIIKIVFIEKKDIFISVLCGFIAGITAVALFAASGYLISKSALEPPFYTLIILTASVKMLGIISGLSRYGERYYSHRGTFTMLSNFRVYFYEKLEPLAPGIFHKFRSGDLLSRIVGDVESLKNFFLRVLYPPLVLLLVFICTIIFTAFNSVEIALVILAGFILTTFVIPVLFALRQRKVNNQIRKTRGEFSTEITEFLYGFRDLKIYQQLGEKEDQLKGAADDYLQEQEQNNVQQLYSQSVNNFAALVISLAVLAVGAYLVSVGQLNGIFLAMLVMISLTAFQDTAPMAVFSNYFAESSQASERLNAVIGDPEAQNESGADLKSLSLQTGPSVEMKNVHFQFPEETRAALSGINVTIPAGSKTAVVGPSGSGKSTLMGLLLNIYNANKGEITINNRSIRTLTAESIWENTNAVLQGNHFFYGTIRENLQLANDTADDSDMEAVLAKVELEHFALEDQVLEKGDNLSGGERQRLAIARALLKRAPLWLLDEPTSSVDAVTESHIYTYLFQEAEDDTVILISHRLTGLENMDQIIVMDQGQIIETGTFNQLMTQQGYFYEMKQIEQSVFSS